MVDERLDLSIQADLAEVIGGACSAGEEATVRVGLALIVRCSFAYEAVVAWQAGEAARCQTARVEALARQREVASCHEYIVLGSARTAMACRFDCEVSPAITTYEAVCPAAISVIAALSCRAANSPAFKNPALGRGYRNTYIGRRSADSFSVTLLIASVQNS